MSLCHDKAPLCALHGIHSFIPSLCQALKLQPNEIENAFSEDSKRGKRTDTGHTVYAILLLLLQEYLL